MPACGFGLMTARGHTAPSRFWPTEFEERVPKLLLPPLCCIQNPRPVSERNINAFLPKRSAKLSRQLVQHRLDGRVGQMAEIGVDRFAREQRYRFAVRADRAVWARPRVGDFRAGEHARQGGLASFDAAFHPSTGGADSLRNVEDAALGVPALAQADADTKITART